MVKKIVPETSLILLRLIFEHRLGNLKWRWPPWIPGPFGSLDVTKLADIQLEKLDGEPPKKLKKAFEKRPGSFNCQLQAPYLITVIVHKSVFDDTDPNTYVGYKPERVNPGMPSYRHCINMGIFIHSVALAANNHGVDSAFCGNHRNYRIMHKQINQN